MDENRPSLFKYLDYREFIRDYCAFRKEAEPKFSLRAFAATIQPSLGRSGLLSGVLRGQRNIGASMRGKFAKAMEMKGSEAQFFELLVQFNQAEEMEEKNQFFLQLARYRQSRARILKEGHYKFYSKWYYSVLWNYFGMNSGQMHPEAIAKALYPRVTAQEVKGGIELLLQLGLIKRMANGYAVAENHVSTHAEFKGEVAMEYNRQFLGLAQNALERVRPEFRRLNTMVFSLSEDGIAAIHERSLSFMAELQGIIDKDTKADRIYSLALHLFPNSHIPAMLE